MIYSSGSSTKPESKHSKSKSSSTIKHTGEHTKPQIMSKHQFISPTHLSTSGKLTHKFVNSVSNQQDLLGYTFDPNNVPQFTIDNRRNHLNSKYDMAVNHIK